MMPFCSDPQENNHQPSIFPEPRAYQEPDHSEVIEKLRSFLANPDPVLVKSSSRKSWYWRTTFAEGVCFWGSENEPLEAVIERIRQVPIWYLNTTGSTWYPDELSYTHPLTREKIKQAPMATFDATTGTVTLFDRFGNRS